MANRRPQYRSQLSKPFKRNRPDDRVTIYEMRIQDRLTVFDLLCKASDCNRSPAISFGKHACSGDDPLLPFRFLPLFTITDTHWLTPALTANILAAKFNFSKD